MVTSIELSLPIIHPVIWRTLTLAVHCRCSVRARWGSIPGRHDLEPARRRL
jgi:hypothetical protein